MKELFTMSQQFLFDRNISTKPYLRKAGYDVEIEGKRLESIYLEAYKCVAR